MSYDNDEKEPDYQSDPGAVRGPRREKTVQPKRDYDLIVGVLIITMVFTVIGLWAMTHMYP